METIAEGIETGEQLSELQSVSCNFGQGFLLSKPLDQESAEKILERYGNQPVEINRLDS
jgi:EAL domain-containing protein (putative c-di-GMP-specific phosphodiesterase class I)